MPVFRDEAIARVIPEAQRRETADRLASELAGANTPDGPLIFEIPFQQPDRFETLVVWDAWDPFDSEDRTSIILDAYGDRRPSVAQALGVTRQEAIEQQVLPYAVTPMARPEEANFAELRRAMIEEGGFALASGRIFLQFPTMALAEQCHRRLSDRLPSGYWSIAYNVASLPR